MSKAVMLSIRPKWMEKIASGEKTIEVRKTRPKLVLCEGGLTMAEYIERTN